MIPTTEYQSAIITLTEKARTYNTKIGNYIEHFRNENLDFIVNLDNKSKIKIFKFIPQDYEKQPNSITKEDIKKIADTWTKI